VGCDVGTRLDIAQREVIKGKINKSNLIFWPTMIGIFKKKFGAMF
jgi:hypothetical protein